MISTGMVRRLDALGRIVLPVELRRVLGIGTRDDLEIWREGESIALRRRGTGCVFCGGCDGLETFRTKSVCRRCLDALTKTLR